jgi:hypothetical protein
LLATVDTQERALKAGSDLARAIEARGIDRVLAIAYQHPAIAAEKAAACGCDPVTIELIRHHQDTERGQADALLQLFQQVDDQN